LGVALLPPLKGAKHRVFDGNTIDLSDSALGQVEMSPPSLPEMLRQLRHTINRKTKFFLSASRVVLGQRRWIASVTLLASLSLGLLAVGMAAIVAPYSRVENAALTADAAPQVIALDVAPADQGTPSAKLALTLK
jgi:hypothetical protein